MKVYYSELFVQKIAAQSISVKRALKKKIKLLIENPRHPSLRVKKIKGQNNIFEASVNMSIRLTWQYYNDGILLRNLGEHDKTLGNP
jgi:mRNA-degrading endonuclease YafQ of YafQ-DinJ toxin-antitoxin module